MKTFDAPHLKGKAEDEKTHYVLWSLIEDLKGVGTEQHLLEAGTLQHLHKIQVIAGIATEVLQRLPGAKE